MLPYVVLHNAATVDGKIGGFVPDLELYYELAGGFDEDATLTGADTMLAAVDEGPVAAEAETASSPLDEEDTRPLLVITDSRGRVRTWRDFLGGPYWRAGVALCSRSTPGEYLEYLRREGVDAIVAGDRKIDLREALEELNARYGVNRVRADSGGSLNGALLRGGLVDEVSVLVCPLMAGGSGTGSLFREPDDAAAKEAVKLKLLGAEALRGGSVWLRFQVLKRGGSTTRTEHRT